MSKGRIADIMQESGALQNVTYIRLIGGQKALILYLHQNHLGNILSKRFAERGDFHGMCQPRTDKIRLIQRKYLRLILQAPEGSTSNDAMVILLKFCPQIIGRSRLLKASDSVIT